VYEKNLGQGLLGLFLKNTRKLKKFSTEGDLSLQSPLWLRPGAGFSVYTCTYTYTWVYTEKPAPGA